MHSDAGPAWRRLGVEEGAHFSVAFEVGDQATEGKRKRGDGLVWYASRVEGFVGRGVRERVKLLHAEDGQDSVWTLAEWQASWEADEITHGSAAQWTKALKIFARKKQQSLPRNN